jgi:hypothetical protein
LHPLYDGLDVPVAPELFDITLKRLGLADLLCAGELDVRLSQREIMLLELACFELQLLLFESQLLLCACELSTVTFCDLQLFLQFCTFPLLLQQLFGLFVQLVLQLLPLLPLIVELALQGEDPILHVILFPFP